MVASIGASVILLTALYFIVTEKIDKVIAISGCAISMVILGMATGFYSQKEALAAIDFNTLGLLLGMMIIASMLKNTGFFTYIAITLAKLSKGIPWKLMALLGVSTAFLSMMVDNVTTVVIIGPITILVCDILGINPLPVLMTEILLSIIGGVATLVGDPPNIFIGSAAGLSFNDFLKNLFPLTVAVIFISLSVLMGIYRKKLQDKPRNIHAILKIKTAETIKDRKSMIKCVVVLFITFTLFFLHDTLHLYPSFIALFGAGLAFLLIRPNPEEIFRDVEWSVLAFFLCFFVIVGGLNETGVLFYLANKTVHLAKVDITAYKIALLWVTALLSSMVGAVPFTMVMIPVVKTLSVFGVNGNSLWWILALGVGFGANGLPVGHAAGILGIAISRKSRAPITTKEWLRSGSTVTLVSLVFITVLILAGLF